MWENSALIELVSCGLEITVEKEVRPDESAVKTRSPTETSEINFTSQASVIIDSSAWKQLLDELDVCIEIVI